MPCPPSSTALINLATTGIDIRTLTPALHTPRALSSLSITFTTEGTTNSFAKSYRTPFASHPSSHPH